MPCNREGKDTYIEMPCNREGRRQPHLASLPNAPASSWATEYIWVSAACARVKGRVRAGVRFASRALTCCLVPR
jgi:hypothetical protein